LVVVDSRVDALEQDAVAIDTSHRFIQCGGVGRNDSSLLLAPSSSFDSSDWLSSTSIHHGRVVKEAVHNFLMLDPLSKKKVVHQIARLRLVQRLRN